MGCQSVEANAEETVTSVLASIIARARGLIVIIFFS
jgi:hypothetical protein